MENGIHLKVISTEFKQLSVLLIHSSAIEVFPLLNTTLMRSL